MKNRRPAISYDVSRRSFLKTAGAGRLAATAGEAETALGGPHRGNPLCGSCPARG